MVPSAPEIVNPVPVDESEGWLRSFLATIQGSPFGPDFEAALWRRQQAWDAARTWGARDRGRWVGSLGTLPRTLTVPAGLTGTRDIAADALTVVTVAATHRRRGLLTGMLNRSLTAAHERGDPVSMLIAAEWPIYGRFGYAPASDVAAYRLHPRAAGAVRGAVPERVRWSAVDEIHELAPAVYEAARQRHAGEVNRPGAWWSRVLGTDGHAPHGSPQYNWVVHESAEGVPDGLLGWNPARQFTHTRLGAASVTQFLTASDAAYSDLWAFLLGLDGVGEIELPERAVDEPVRRLLTDGRALELTERHDMLWVRLLDVPAALSARGYAADGEVVLDVVDDPMADGVGGWAAGRFALTVHDGAGSCVPTTRPADLRVDQRVLASRYLGGFPLSELPAGGDVEELTAGSLPRLDAMFATLRQPWTQTPF